MRFTAPAFLTVALAVAVVFGIGVFFGHPLFSPELGMTVAMAGAVMPEEIKELVVEQGRAFQAWQKRSDAEIAALSENVADLMLSAGRPNGADKGRSSTSEQKEAMDVYLRKGDDRALADLQKKAMNSTSDPDGGYLVLPEMEREVDRVVGTLTAMERLARVVRISSRSWQKRVKTSGMSMRRVAEGSGGGESTEPKYAQIEIVVHPAEVEPWVHNATLEDADIDLAADLSQEAGISFAEGGGSEFINGDGVGKARGILQYPIVANASYAWGKIGYIASGKSGAFASVAPADKLVDLVHALKPQYRQGAAFVMNDKTLGVVRQMKDGSGSYYLFQQDPTGQLVGRLLGYPVEVDDNMPDIAANSYSVAFGNFQRGYAVVRRNGITLIRDNVTTKGVTKFNFTRRFGGGVYNFEAIKLMKFATS